MRNLGVNEAANAIRGIFSADRSFRGLPEEAHQIKFAKDVTVQLGADPSPENVIHVMALLREAEIDLPAGQEYPKYVIRKWDRTSKIVHSEQEANDWENEAQPEPVDPDTVAARTLDAPVQDLSVDLQHQVPQHGSHGGDAPAAQRIPSAITNREAAQDAYARQPVETRDRDEAATAYARANPETGGVHHDDDLEDDGVHVEHVDLDTKAPTGSKAEGGAPYAKPANVGVMANDDPDRDHIAGQDKDPTHDSVLGTEEPKNRSGDSSAGRTDKAPRPVGVGKNPKRPE